MKIAKLFGPSALVTAAFIGPGTLTVCTVAGVEFGHDLIWVLVFATIATIILQGMAARLGSVTGSGLGEALQAQIVNPAAKFLSLGLVFIAIIIGNAAYEAGNVSGAVLGLEADGFDHFFWGPLILGLIVVLILWNGNIHRIQWIMGALVGVMSVVFIGSAIAVGSLEEIGSGLIPDLNSKNQLTALALIGTTIVPYNLFLHASAAAKSGQDLKSQNLETMATISIGGLISICVLMTASAGIGGAVQGITDMAIHLEPMLGRLSKPFLSVGIFAAGISSALTAPLAASLTAKGIFGWQEEWKSRIVWGGILLIGIIFSMAGFKPISVIQVAQIANGVLLPIIVVFLLILTNRKSLMGDYKNSLFQNALGILVLLIALVISFRSFNSVFQFLQ